MAFDLTNYAKLCNLLAEIDLFGGDTTVRPKLDSAEAINAAITKGAAHIPLDYRDTYAVAIGKELPNILLATQDLSPEERDSIIEIFYAPIYEHAAIDGMRDLRQPLRRFLAVVSNLFRSFVSVPKRASLKVPVVKALPPLAFFESDGSSGPYTVTSETIEKKFGVPVAVVSLPMVYHNHAILWCSLAHEVCGHDVVHADPELVPEMVKGLRKMFVGDSFAHAESRPLDPDLLNALLWSYWIDEAVADVYGVLNMGPTFALNLTAFFSAMLARAFLSKGLPKPSLPFLRNVAGPHSRRSIDQPEQPMDTHPVDLLRPYLAIGVIESLSQLSRATKESYIAAIKAATEAAAHGKTQVVLKGQVEISHTNWRMIDTTIPLAEAQEGARRVGAFLATTKMAALDEHNIQDVETWADKDEETAKNVAAHIAANQSIVSAGDDAQLLAGVNLALLEQPDRYEQALTLLNAALDDSYQRDPLWGDVTFKYVINL